MVFLFLRPFKNQHHMTIIIDFLPAFGLIGLLFVFIKNNWVTKQEVGNEKMAKIAHNIAKRAMSFLKAEYKILSIFVVCLAILLYIKGAMKKVLMVWLPYPLWLERFAQHWQDS